MTYKTFASPLALAVAAALTLSSGAFAQTMVGDQEVSDEDLEAVTNHCAMLAEDDIDAGDATTDEVVTDDATTDDTAPPDTGGVVDDSIPTEDAPGAAADEATDEMAPNTTAGDGAAGDQMAAGGATGELNLEAITLEDCEAAAIGV